MSLPSHHPGDTLLIDYSGGALCEGASLVVATHLAFCPCCRRLVTEMDAVGGALLEDLEPEPLDPGCLDALLARIDREENTLPPAAPPPARRRNPPKPPRAPRVCPNPCAAMCAARSTGSPGVSCNRAWLMSISTPDGRPPPG
ncbi:hypothetical protein [Azospirillum cavernae]|uniref:hypothetical protein n=1 Tax=Azospirillum cavernae TaxID=2320860 RepID=UPI001EE629CB|nr:hypothetical protein [Azospirillum cavernae]